MIEHDWYGPCDALLPDGGCSVCAGSPNHHIGATLDVAHMAETGEVRTYDCRTTHHEGCACHEAAHRSEVERITRERDEALREVTRLRGVVHTYMTSHDEQIAQERLALIGQAARDLATETATRAALRTQESRILGILADAGVPVGDVVRGVEALARRHDALNAEVNALHQELADMDPNATANAHRWSRLWHREARRLWAEVQALSEPDAPYVDIEDVAEFLRKLGGDQ